MRLSPHAIALLVGAAPVLLLGLSCGDSTTPTAATAATTMATIPATARPDAPFRTTDFTASSICGGCHDEIYRQWQGSLHNHSLTDAFFVGMQAQAGRETGAGADYCVACHTPFGGDSGEVPPTTGPQISQNTLEGIQCDFCHTLTDPQTYGPSVVKRGQFSDSGSTFHETAYSELLTTSYFCGLCHDQNSPDNNLPLQATYTEWKNSPYATQGIQCQDCHMTPGPGVTKPNPGKAAVGGPDRPHIYTHDFTGGNASELASGEHRQLARRNLQAAATLQLTTPASTTPGSDLEVLVTVNNTGAGHYLPTGVTEIREMWLDVTVIDAGGNTVYQSGAIDENGAVDPRAVMYRTEFRDKDGQPTNKPWLAAGILADHRVPPMGSLTEKYGIPVPADAALPLTVQATLRYRTAPQPLVDDLLGRDELAIPVIDMASARAEVR